MDLEPKTHDGFILKPKVLVYWSEDDQAYIAVDVNRRIIGQCKSRPALMNSMFERGYDCRLAASKGKRKG